MSRRELMFGSAAAGCLLFMYWPTLANLMAKWGSDPRYSHGYLVPLFSVALLWFRRDQLPTGSLRPSWWGVPVLTVGLLLHLAGAYLFFDWFSGVCLMPCLAGLVLLLGGWRLLGWSWPAIAFLVFMLPLPYRLEIALAHPLQRIATLASTYALQTLGFATFAEGNVIRLGQIRMGVVEACSGLSMLVIFFALSTAVTLLVARPWLDKSVIILSAIPIAVIANVVRITVTGVLHKTVGSELANLVFHDLAGYLMMLLALGILWLEMKALAWMVVSVPRRQKALASWGLYTKQAKADSKKLVSTKEK